MQKKKDNVVKREKGSDL